MLIGMIVVIKQHCIAIGIRVVVTIINNTIIKISLQFSVSDFKFRVKILMIFSDNENGF